jgi:hypothetical protein
LKTIRILLLLLAAAVPLVAGVMGCSGADNPKIVDAPPPPPPPPDAAKQNLPRNKYMENDRYKQGMEKMQRAQSGK